MVMRIGDLQEDILSLLPGEKVVGKCHICGKPITKFNDKGMKLYFCNCLDNVMVDFHRDMKLDDLLEERTILDDLYQISKRRVMLLAENLDIFLELVKDETSKRYICNIRSLLLELFEDYLPDNDNSDFILKPIENS